MEIEVFDAVQRPFDVMRHTDGTWPDESIAFSERAREAGLELWINHEASLLVGHVGEETYDFG